MTLNGVCIEDMSDSNHKDLKITLINIKNAHGLVLRVTQGELQIDASGLPSARQEQAYFDSDIRDSTPHPEVPNYVTRRRVEEADVFFRKLMSHQGQPLGPYTLTIKTDDQGSHFLQLVVNRPLKDGVVIPTEVDGVPVQLATKS